MKLKDYVIGDRNSRLAPFPGFVDWIGRGCCYCGTARIACVAVVSLGGWIAGAAGAVVAAAVLTVGALALSRIARNRPAGIGHMRTPNWLQRIYEL